MPTYSYRCKACGHQFDEFQRITADPIRVCPQCKKEEAKRIITGGSGFVLKGSGFYSTDYRSSSYQEGAKKAEADAKSSSIPNTTKKKDSKKSG